MFWGIFLSLQQTASANGEWKHSETENFHVIGSASEISIEQIVGKFEGFRQSFFKLFPQSESKSPIPTNILIFKSEIDFNFYLKSQTSRSKNELAGNIFQAGEDANYIVVFINEGRETDFRRIYHQYFHYLLNNHVGKSKIPAWLNEGLAQVYEDFQTNGNLQISFQSVEKNKFQILTQNKLLSSEIFFNTDYYSLNQQENHGVGVFYAQASALVQYLIQQNGEEKFRQFTSLISLGYSLNESLIKAFQTDLPAIERNLKTFIEQKSFENSQTTKNQTIEISKLKFSPVSSAETEAFLGDFLYQANRLDEAELHLLKSLSLKPFASFPQSTLGLVKLRQYKYDEAFQYLNKSLELEDANYLSHYRYAHALSRKGMTEYGFVSSYNAETAERIMELLKKSIELNPEFAGSYNLYALVSFVRNDKLDEGLSYITKALKIAAGNDWYLLRKSELDMRKENFTEARKNALKIYQNAPDGGLRLYAQNTIQRIDSTEYQLLQSRRNREKYPYSDIISEIPFSDAEIARLRAKAMLESLNTVLRRPAPDEKRVLGTVVGIDCRQNQVNFTVKINNDFIKLSADSFESLNLMTFNYGQTKTEIGCGTLNKENSAVIIYRKSADSKSEISGEILSIEFVPKEFTLSERD